jgi:hypothetical protein
MTPNMEDVLPDEMDVLFYEEHGYYVTEKILPSELINNALRGAERHWAGERDHPLPVSGGFADWRPEDAPGGIRNSEYTALQNRDIRALVSYPVIGAIAARLSRSPIIRLWDDQLIAKVPVAGPKGPVVGWHTDRAYWMTCSSESMLTAWIPFQDTPEEMGPVIYIDGSHKWPGTEVMRTFSSQEIDWSNQLQINDNRPINHRVMALTKGQISFHHSRLIHGSRANRSDRTRVSLALHMQDAQNHYQIYARPTVPGRHA